MANSAPIWIGACYSKLTHKKLDPNALGRNVLLVRKLDGCGRPGNPMWHWLGGEVPQAMYTPPYVVNGRATPELAELVLQNSLERWVQHAEKGKSLIVKDCTFVDSYHITRSHLNKPLEVQLFKVHFTDGTNPTRPTPIKGKTMTMYYPTKQHVVLEEGIRDFWNSYAEENNYFRRSYAA